MTDDRSFLSRKECRAVVAQYPGFPPHGSATTDPTVQPFRCLTHGLCQKTFKKTHTKPQPLWPIFYTPPSTPRNGQRTEAACHAATAATLVTRMPLQHDTPATTFGYLWAMIRDQRCSNSAVTHLRCRVGSSMSRLQPMAAALSAVSPVSCHVHARKKWSVALHGLHRCPHESSIHFSIPPAQSDPGHGPSMPAALKDALPRGSLNVATPPLFVSSEAPSRL